MKPRSKPSIRRLLLGMTAAAVPIALFGRPGMHGILISMAIGIPLVLICLIATREQLRSAVGILACTTFGWFIGSLLPAMRLSESQSNMTWSAVAGCIIGLLWSEAFYAGRDTLEFQPRTNIFLDR